VAQPLDYGTPPPRPPRSITWLEFTIALAIASVVIFFVWCKAQQFP
jgi:hypothetical protein